jgi:2-dehydro-3-deoxyphosphogluconate aldolase/(4S)-4-hydroxy-2-oxoglutarate aldolase
MNELIRNISNYGIVPVIKIDNIDKAVPLAETLISAGLPVAEVTFRTVQAEASIRSIVETYPDMLVGAGTVLSVEQVDKAVDAGAKFIVTPGFNPKIIRYCINKGITIIPGTSTASDMAAALEMGLEVVKFFPAEQSGGVEYLKAVGGPYTTLKFIPTGGINAKNLNSYLSLKNVVACGGSWMVKSDLIDAGDFDTVKDLTRQAIQIMLGFSLDHIGINCIDLDEADGIAKKVSKIFDFEYKMGNSSIFVGKAVEVMKFPFLGKKGHIAIKTNSVDRAIAYLSEIGISFDENTRKLDSNGKTKAIYLSEEIGGFAIHLLN